MNELQARGYSGVRRLTIDEAHAKKRPTIVVGSSYPFYSEVEQEYEPADQRLRRYTGQCVRVLGVEEKDDPDNSQTYMVRAADGREFTAWEEELNGWDFDLGQYFKPEA